MKTILLSVLALGFFMTAGAQTAASGTTNHNVTLTLSNAIDIKITSTPADVTFTFNTPDLYTNGITTTNATTFQVRSNKAYNVTVNAAAANFTATGTATGAPTMPVGVLGVRKSGTTTWLPLSTTAALVTTGTNGTNTFNVDYQANPGFNYWAGSYVANVVYTATQQ